MGYTAFVLLAGKSSSLSPHATSSSAHVFSHSKVHLQYLNFLYILSWWKHTSATAVTAASAASTSHHAVCSCVRIGHNSALLHSGRFLHTRNTGSLDAFCHSGWLLMYWNFCPRGPAFPPSLCAFEWKDMDSSCTAALISWLKVSEASVTVSAVDGSSCPCCGISSSHSDLTGDVPSPAFALGSRAGWGLDTVWCWRTSAWWP